MKSFNAHVLLFSRICLLHCV